MATIYIPLALVSILGETSRHPSPESAAEARGILDHSMDLVQAIRIACMRVMTETRVTAYRSFILSWLDSLPKVLPNASLRPNCHMACHIYDYLRLFGPVRSWWCFPFERLIGHLQRLPNNHHYGQFSCL